MRVNCRIRQIGAAAVLGALLAGCTTLKSTDNQQGTFPGLIKMAEASHGPLRMFLIHGISQHEVGWALGYLQPIASQAGWTVSKTDGAYAAVKVPGRHLTTGADLAVVQVYTVSQGGQPKIIAYELTWSPITTPFKTERFAANLSAPVAWVNGILRDVVDNRLSDVALYMGRYDDNILPETVDRSLEMFYTGELDPHPNLATADVVFVSESLGSKMLFDALSDQYSNRRSLNHPQKFQDMLGNNRIVFMMANQLALLELPSPEDSSAVSAAESAGASKRRRFRSLEQYVQVQQGLQPQALAGAPAKGLSLVAFNDPNDVLSFPLEQADLPAVPGLQLFNFAPKNGWSWFGIAESPATAHEGYSTNPRVLNIVLNGYGS